MQTKWTASVRYVDIDVDRARLRGTIGYRLHRRIQIGIELNPEVDEITPLVSLFLLTETDRRPALFLGTSSDRIGSPEGTQSYYATLSKRFANSPLSAYVSLNYSEWDAGFNVPFGVEIQIAERRLSERSPSSGVSVRPMYDGESGHLMLNYYRERWSVSLLAVDFEHPGIAFSWGF